MIGPIQVPSVRLAAATPRAVHVTCDRIGGPKGIASFDLIDEKIETKIRQSIRWPRPG
jgi:hypothetical protein